MSCYTTESGSSERLEQRPSGGRRRPLRFLPRGTGILRGSGCSTTTKASSATVRCNALAFYQGALSQVSISSGVVRVTGIAFSWIGTTTALGMVVRKP